jgi:hypothetical protein
MKAATCTGTSVNIHHTASCNISKAAMYILMAIRTSILMHIKLFAWWKLQAIDLFLWIQILPCASAHDFFYVDYLCLTPVDSTSSFQDFLGLKIFHSFVLLLRLVFLSLLILPSLFAGDDVDLYI